MRTLLIGNTRTEEMVGDLAALSPQAREAAGYGAHRMLWWAREGDVLVLPTLPDEAFADYVAALTGTPRASVTVLAPAPGRLGSGLLTPDRLADPALEEALRGALRKAQGSGPAGLRITPVYPDATVADLARRLGAEAALPGFAFHAQGGSALVNSKAAFRAVAAGAGVPIAPGTVVIDPGEAARAIRALLGGGHCAIAKQEFSGGGLGNEILAPAPGVEPAGAPRAVVLPDGAAIDAYVAERWPWLTEGGRHRLVVERYYAGAVPVYAEFVVADHAVELTGTGEMLMDPVVVGEIVPASARLTADATAELITVGRHLCEAYRALGYRGTISADAYLTPQGEIRFCEANGRITGSTHLHTVMAERLVGPAVRPRRVLLGGECAAPSFPAAVAALDAAGLGFDPATGTGVVLVNDFGPAAGAVMYCVIAEDVAGARERQRETEPLLAKAAA
ncbi:peptide ligase PGM1-related protein [Streptomyces sp. NBC_01477]|uniref:preATP grasp domain-containing protein n=1 Tax=Streptomyces sp. NBC_01477 TaxID=2976015 RepID=UPI002E35536B|nr:peptide ligase PGM1-related protein [Streptomyces sp. NBC_01477]